MKYNALIERPKCTKHGEYMHLRADNQLSEEAALCGAWYDCPAHGCTCSVLLPSVMLKTLVHASIVRPKRKTKRV
ncbi:MAG: iron-containing alcohol dehydrogenase [Clostridiales bacterium]|nr:iron-containing alcohol dehydrogenase [Clostridiales bacterium]